MTLTPELDEFRRRLDALRRDPVLGRFIKRGIVHFSRLKKEEVAALLQAKDRTAYYFLLSAAGLNRTTLKREVASPEVRVAPRALRSAYAVCRRLPITESFEAVTSRALALRAADLGRKGRSGVEQIFRERLVAEGIPLLMSPPIRQVPGLLVDRRKPDGVYPDPASGMPPLLYLEVKNIKRVADDIQKRLYELAEASLEMKLLYGRLRLTGLDLSSTRDVSGSAALRSKLRRMITKARPTVVGLFLCPRAEAERYRAGAETFVDRLFFEEEVDECLAFLRAALP